MVRRTSAETAAAILAAAREQFGRDGPERTTVRSVATRAGVDPALVIRYFGSKAELFARAADLALDLPDLAGLDEPQVADALVVRFLAAWEHDGTFLALLRAATTSEEAAARLRDVFATQVAPALAVGAVDHPDVRAALVGSQVIGFALARYVLLVPPLVDLDHDGVRRWLGPALVRLLTEPVAGPVSGSDDARTP